MKNIIKQFATLFIFSFISSTQLFAQKDSISDISAFIYLDSFVVTASKNGFDKDDFIEMVRTDDSFLEAFQNLRFISYQSTNSFKYFNKKGIEKASYQDTIRQIVSNNCRTMEYLSTNTQGKYFKKSSTRDYNYFTSELHDRLFYTHKKVCESPDDPALRRVNASRIEKYVFELKKLMFRPGEKADIPFIGDKTSIFEPPMIHFYDFKISNDLYNEQVDCYVFSADVKPVYKGKNKVIIKHLKTYFDKSTFQVVGRDYQLAYTAGLYQFDVQINVELIKIDTKYYPIQIRYAGYWNVPIKKREAAEFQLEFYDFKNQKS